MREKGDTIPSSHFLKESLLLPPDFFERVERKLDFVVSGDSISEDTETIIKFSEEEEIQYLTFKEIWDKLSDRRIYTIGDKEYIQLIDTNIRILNYNYNNDQLVLSKPNYIMRHKISEHITILRMYHNKSLELTNNHSLIDYEDGKFFKNSPENMEYAIGIKDQFEDETEYFNLKSIKPIRIESKESIFYDGYVYDFSVPKTHNFIANGIVVSNTDSLFINIPGLIPTSSEDAVLKSQEVSKEINQIIKHYYDNFLLQKMGIDPKHNGTDFKTELIADRLLLLDIKKNYAYRILAKEGKIYPIPEIKYVGIPVIRSDYSTLTRKFLQRIIEEIVMNKLHSESLKELNNIAKEIRDEMIESIRTCNFHPIGRPCKWSASYTAESEKEDPFQVIACRFYNTIMDQRVFTPLSSGIYVPISIANSSKFESLILSVRNKNEYYLNEVPTSKLTRLAVPYDYQPDKLEAVMKKLEITINTEEVWNTILGTSAIRIIDIIKRHIK